MLLRKLVAALCPLLLCIVLCLLYRWLDGVLGAGLFWSFLLKGLLLGVMLALIIPLAGLRCHSKGLQPWLYVGAALLAVTLCYQYLETTGVVHSALLLSLFTLNGQVILIEGAAAGFMTVTALLSKH